MLIKELKKDSLKEVCKKYKEVFESILSEDEVLLLGFYYIPEEKYFAYCDHELVVNNYEHKMYAGYNGSMQFKNIDLVKLAEDNPDKYDWHELSGIMNLAELELMRAGHESVKPLYFSQRNGVSEEEFFALLYALGGVKFYEYFNEILHNEYFEFKVRMDQETMINAVEVLKEEGLL